MIGLGDYTTVAREVIQVWSVFSQFFAACRVQLVPVLQGTFSTDSIQSFIAENGSLMVLDSATNQYGVGRLHDHGGIRQTGENCRVTGLTLLRGGIVLSHNGFTVTGGSQIEIIVSKN